MISDYIYKWLEIALDYGITEIDFWNMTLAELERAIDSKKRVKRLAMQEEAMFNYILADLIGKSVSRIYSSNNSYPELSAVYPSLFDSKVIEEKKQEQREQLNILRFRQFANSYNKKYKEAAKKDG